MRAISARCPVYVFLSLALLSASLGACAVCGGAKNEPAREDQAGEGREYLRLLGDISGTVNYLEQSGGARVQLPARLFISPASLSARSGSVFIVDSGTQAVYRYDRYKSSIKKIVGLPSYMDSCVFVKTDESFYLSDPFKRRVYLFDHNGGLVRTYKDDFYLMFPTSVAVNEANGDVYVADGMRDDIIVFNGVGQIVKIIGAPEGKEGKIFGRIEGLALGDGKLYVADSESRKINVMNLDGKYMYSFGQDDLSKPGAIAATDSRVFVVDTGSNSIKIFQDEAFAAEYRGKNPHDRMFSQISGIAADEGLVYVSDALAGKVFIFMSPPTGGEKMASAPR